MTPSTTATPVSPISGSQFTYINFSACTISASCNTTNLASSTHGTNTGWNNGMSAAETAIANPFPAMPFPVTISGTTYTGVESGALAALCTTSGTGSSCGPYSVNIAATGAGTTAAFAHWMLWTCPESVVSGTIQDCGDVGGIIGTGGGDTAVFHISGVSCSQGSSFIEIAGAAFCTNQIPVWPNTIYRVNLLFTKGSPGTKKMTICDVYGNVLGTQTTTSGTNQSPTEANFMLFGEEPTVSGYLFEMGGIIYDSTGAQFSTSACF
jgi:hypothetical protein